MNTTDISQADNGTKRQVFHFLQSGSGIVVFAVIFIVGTIITEGAFAATEAARRGSTEHEESAA